VECRGFDEQVVRHDPRIASLMKQFVGVRVVQFNGTDLARFQFDPDLTYAAFFMNADGTLYGRFGSRSDMKDAEREISVEGFGKALAAALELHKGFPANKSSLLAKTGPPTRFKSPEEYPSLKGRYQRTLDPEKPVQSCVHCHQVLEAERKMYRSAGRPIPDEWLRPWPMPDVVGLSFDPKEKAKLRSVAAGSSAARDGFKAGDEILTLEGQPIISIADVQFVMHFAKAPAALKAEVLRAGKKSSLTLTLAADWRRPSNFAWRPSAWDLRRMGTGGLKLDPPSSDLATKAGIAPNSLALEIKHAGEYGEHALAKNAGFRKGDIIVAVDGKSAPMTEAELLALMLAKPVGAKVPATVVRGGQRLDLQIPTQ
jgi:hypothetical protein